jgi:hypothetical protein
MPTVALSGTVIFGSDSQANGRLFFCSHFGGSSLIYDTVNTTAGRINAGSQTETGWTSPHILTVYRIGAIMSVRRNGVEIAGRTNASGNYSSTTANLQIGKCDGAGNNQMYISEWVTYASELSSSQIATIERGFGKKWGVPFA